VTPERERLDEIDGLRGFAALLVVASHASAGGMNLAPGWSLEGTGKYGVFLFFVISAYLLTAQWLQSPPSAHGLGRYLVRRVVRIYPLYALVLVVGWALTPPGLGVSLDARAVWRHLGLQEGRSVYWSVPVEFVYYLVIPPLAWWLLSAWPAWIRASAVLVGLVGLMWAFPAHEAPLNSINLTYYLPTFVCGSLAAWCLQARPTVKAAVKVVGGRWLDLALLLAVVLAVPSVFSALGWGKGLDTLHRQFLAWGLFWSLVVLALRWQMLPLTSRMLRWGPLGRCGQWCFGIYLLHMPVLLAVRRVPLLPSELKAWLALLFAVGIAALAWRWVERPCIRWAQRRTR
jgi:peptidoglycan/LPS O-acetylase OafA/YrhL